MNLRNSGKHLISDIPADLKLTQFFFSNKQTQHVEDSGLLGCEALSLGEWFPAFRRMWMGAHILNGLTVHA